jgi:hypothetical protein
MKLIENAATFNDNTTTYHKHSRRSLMNTAQYLYIKIVTRIQPQTATSIYSLKYSLKREQWLFQSSDVHPAVTDEYSTELTRSSAKLTALNTVAHSL